MHDPHQVGGHQRGGVCIQVGPKWWTWTWTWTGCCLTRLALHFNHTAAPWFSRLDVSILWDIPDMFLMEFCVRPWISSQDRVTLKSKTRINKWPDYIAEQVTWLHCTTCTGHASPANKGQSHKLCLLEYYYDWILYMPTFILSLGKASKKKSIFF